jgi:hypothetical protein
VFVTEPEAKAKLEQKGKDGPNSSHHQKTAKYSPWQKKPTKQDVVIHARTKQAKKLLKF